MAQKYYCNNESFMLMTRTVVDKEEFDDFAKEVDISLEALDKGLINVKDSIEKHNTKFLVLNNHIDTIYDRTDRIDDTVKALLISNIITAAVAVSGVILAFLA